MDDAQQRRSDRASRLAHNVADYLSRRVREVVEEWVAQGLIRSEEQEEERCQLLDVAAQSAKTQLDRASEYVRAVKREKGWK